jgi:hypothetical protein
LLLHAAMWIWLGVDLPFPEPPERNPTAAAIKAMEGPPKRPQHSRAKSRPQTLAHDWIQTAKNRELFMKRELVLEEAGRGVIEFRATSR